MKFAVGDIIIGNLDASQQYNITRAGTIWTVIRSDETPTIRHGDLYDILVMRPDNPMFRKHVDLAQGHPIYEVMSLIGDCFAVDSEYFNSTGNRDPYADKGDNELFTGLLKHRLGDLPDPKL